MSGIYRAFDPWSRLDDGVRSDLLFRWLVLSRRCREAEAA